MSASPSSVSKSQRLEDNTAHLNGFGSLTDCRRFPQSAVGDVFADGDSITCAALHRTGLVVGTTSGWVWLVESSGGKPSPLWQHGHGIVSIAFDSTGTFVAATALDGAVVVRPLTDSTACFGSPHWKSMYARPILSVALCPRYATGAIECRTICIGGEEGKLILSRQTTFGSPRNVTVHSGEGHITSIQWQGSLIAWANAKGVKVVNVETYQKVTHVSRPINDTDKGDDPNCCLTWSSDHVLLIGWGNTVIVAEVKQKTGGPAGVQFAKVTHCFHFSFGNVTGVAVFDDEHLAILSKNVDDRGVPGTRRIGYHIFGLDGDVLCSDEFVTFGVEQSFCLLLRGENQTSCIVTAHELIVIERRSLADHADWLIQHSQFEAAVVLASHSSNSQIQRQNMFSRCLTLLLEHGEFDRAIRIVQKLGRTDAEMWLECIRLFDEVGVLPILLPEVPVPPRSTPLPCSVYDTTLRRLAAISPEALLVAINQWPSSIYSPGLLMATLHEALAPMGVDTGVSTQQGATLSLPKQEGLLVESLSSLYKVQGDYAMSARLLAQVGSRSLFPFLACHLQADKSLQACAQLELRRLFELDPFEALTLFVDHVSVFSPNAVIAALVSYGRWWQHCYLKTLFPKNPAAAQFFSKLSLSLAAEVAPHELRDQLELVLSLAGHPDHAGSSGDSSVGIAEINAEFLANCAGISASAEAFFLVQQGREHEAMVLLLQQLGDIRGAVHLVPATVSDQSRLGLWETLEAFAIKDVRSCALLLANMSVMRNLPALPGATATHLIHRVSPNLELSTLALHISDAFTNVEADVDVNASSLKLMRQATSSCGHKLFKTQRRGIAVDLSKPHGHRVRPPRRVVVSGGQQACVQD